MPDLANDSLFKDHATIEIYTKLRNKIFDLRQE